MKVRLFLFSILTWMLMTSSYAANADIEAALMNKDYQQVNKLAQEVLQRTADPKERIPAEYYLGLSQLRLGKFAQARSAFEIVMSETRQGGSQELYDRAALGMIEGLYIPGFYEEALKLSEELLRKSPHSSFLSLIYLKKARVHLKLTQWKEAKEYLQKVLKEFPDSLEAPIASKLLEEKEYFTVQVGAFLDKDKANELTDKLKTEGQYAYIIETDDPDGKKFYRVRVGQKTSLTEAQSLETNLSKLGYPTLIYP